MRVSLEWVCTVQQRKSLTTTTPRKRGASINGLLYYWTCLLYHYHWSHVKRSDPISYSKVVRTFSFCTYFLESMLKFFSNLMKNWTHIWKKIWTQISMKIWHKFPSKFVKFEHKFWWNFEKKFDKKLKKILVVIWTQILVKFEQKFSCLHLTINWQTFDKKFTKIGQKLSKSLTKD